ncbi:hypothetical protein [Neobacillus dielmonensis]|uniref:hypothetical protein n=1 Tax=Neobacillus dielmonensis TaxID=1347369 RepID=UPI0005A7CAAC|nr:hypothetical protein [Neobacillus dielmonensis]
MAKNEIDRMEMDETLSQRNGRQMDGKNNRDMRKSDDNDRGLREQRDSIIDREQGLQEIRDPSTNGELPLGQDSELHLRGGRADSDPGRDGKGIPNFNRDELMDGDPTVLYGDREPKDTSGLRYGDTMSKNASKEYRQKE